jgi:predicted amidohydrolase
MRIATCQLPEVRGDVARALALMSDYACEAERCGADLVCFPECFLQGYDLRSDHISSMAVELGSAIVEEVLKSLSSVQPAVVFGLIEQAEGVAYNSALAIQGEKAIAHYRKTHLSFGRDADIWPRKTVRRYSMCKERTLVSISVPTSALPSRFGMLPPWA